MNAQNPAEGEFFSLDPEVVTDQSFGAVTAIAVGPSDESLWIGTEDEGILRIGRNGKRIRYTVESGHLLSDGISQMCFVSPSLLYILYSDGWMSSYSPTRGYSQERITDNPVSSILPDCENARLLCVTDNGVVYELRENGGVNLLASISEPVAAMTLANDGKIYFVRKERKAVLSFDGGAFQSMTAPLPEAPTCLLALQNGEFWAGTGQGLFRWSQDAWSSCSTADGLISNRVKDLLYDGSETVFIVTSTGVQALNVSNPDVSNSNVYFLGEPFSCGAISPGADPVFYFGGVHGLASVTSKSVPSDYVWSAREDPSPGKKSGAFRLWYVLLFLAVAAAAFFLGRFISRQRSVAVEKPAPSVAPKKPAPVEKADPDLVRLPEDSPVIVPPSREEVFAAIEKLKSGEAPEFSVKIWNMIEECYSDRDFSVNNIASRLLLSRVHVNRKLQQEIGISPSALLKARRMTAARDLMLRGGLTVPQIAQMAGFSSAAFLSTSFKEYYGESPSAVMKPS